MAHKKVDVCGAPLSNIFCTKSVPEHLKLWFLYLDTLPQLGILWKYFLEKSHRLLDGLVYDKYTWDFTCASLIFQDSVLCGGQPMASSVGRSACWGISEVKELLIIDIFNWNKIKVFSSLKSISIPITFD